MSQQVSLAARNSSNTLSCRTENVTCSWREVIVHFCRLCSEFESHSSILCPVSCSWSWSHTISVWETLYWIQIQISHLDSQQLPCCLYVFLLCWSFHSAKPREGIRFQRYLREDLLVVFIFFAGCSAWASLSGFFCFFLYWACQSLLSFLFSPFGHDMSFLNYTSGNCSSALLTCFYLRLHFSLSSPLSQVMLPAPLWLNPDLPLGFFSWISIWQVINGHCTACVTGVMGWKETFKLPLFL